MTDRTTIKRVTAADRDGRGMSEGGRWVGGIVGNHFITG